MYKLQKPIFDGEQPNGVIRLLDGAAIPFAQANIDYKEYLEWVAEGNTPEAAD